MHRNCGVDRAAALTQHFKASLHGAGICCGDHRALRPGVDLCFGSNRVRFRRCRLLSCICGATGFFSRVEWAVVPGCAAGERHAGEKDRQTSHKVPLWLGECCG